MTPITSVLIVDDEPPVRELMSRWVSSLGLSASTAGNADEALQALQTRHYDLAVIDVMMPGHTGLWLAGELRRDHPHTAVVIATAYTDLLDDAQGDAPIAADLLIKPFERDRFALAVDRGREWRRQAIEDLERHARLSDEVNNRVAHVRAELQQNRSPERDDAAILLAFAREHAPDVVEHAERVVRYALSLARQMNAGAAQLPDIEHSARFHDIGKVAIPPSLLTKPSPLTPGEAAIMRRHVHAGAEILEASRDFKSVAPIVLTTHEWFGGGGYPEKLVGHAIPLASRLIAVADAYDAMTQDRHYRARLDSAEAISELLRGAPSQFDPDVVIAFLTLLARQ